MSSKFFTNEPNNTLFDKFKGIINNMQSFSIFQAVVGYFRTSGYFKLREEIASATKIQILVGIEIDKLYYKSIINNEPYQPHENEIKKLYNNDYIKDLQEAKYSSDVEKGIYQLIEDLQDGKVQIRIYPSKQLHAKFYLFLPENFNEHSEAWVIMGSSNLSDAGLGTDKVPRYELNVSMKDYDDIKFCKDEFEKLWNDAVEITTENIIEYNKQTYIGFQPTPYDIYMKMLYDYFGQEQIEDEFNFSVPNGVMELKYQKDAVVQGYQMLMKYNGFFLADVVGLGKTIIATMITKRFILENGTNSKILVVYPPELERNWKETFKDFSINKSQAQFVSCGSLNKILEGKDNYLPVEEYDVILVDEAHRFRNDNNMMYDYLQRICKSPRINQGRIRSNRKKIMLISATPLNNNPEDLHNLINLFQDDKNCTIEGLKNLGSFFAEKQKIYNNLKKNRDNTNTQKVDELYKDIREKVLDYITIRRTRKNILNNYSEDLAKQNIKFPTLSPPREINYKLSKEIKEVFMETLSIIADEENNDKLLYSRYKAILYLLPDIKNKYYKTAEQTSISLANIYRILLVKRLESSFTAFKQSLKNLRKVTRNMINMFDEDKVIIAPDFNVNDLIDKYNNDIDKVLQDITDKFEDRTKEFKVFSAKDFKDTFYEDLKHDETVLSKLIEKWENIKDDSKLDEFISILKNDIFNKKDNPNGKLVIFSESKDTIKYLKQQLEIALKRNDILCVSSLDVKKQFTTIQENFDANYKNKKNDYNIIITTDVLAEGVNLHRANIIVNYDSPWNASRLMQRIGRVNRIGSVADTIINYMFYPSDEGNSVIRLYQDAVIKLQGFHSALGEDAQVYSKEEVVRQFELFNTDVHDYIDKQIELLKEIQQFKRDFPLEYKKIKDFPLKARTARNQNEIVKELSSIVYISSTSGRKEFYKIDNNKAQNISFIEAVDIFKADKDEPFRDVKDIKEHFMHVSKAENEFKNSLISTTSTNNTAIKLDTRHLSATKTIRNLTAKIKYSDLPESIKIEYEEKGETLKSFIEQGIFTKLTRDMYKIRNDIHKFSTDEVLSIIDKFSKNFNTKSNKNENPVMDLDANIILSETFI
ncbi:MAG: helicase [Bacteroidales bacterium]|nr:helicase [Bacteroidales bacterium]